VVAVALAASAAWLAWPRPFRDEPMPDPNGYDDLVAAAVMVQGDLKSGVLTDETVDELRAFVGSNREALERARVGLGRECRVTLPRPPTPERFAALLDRTQSLRRLARLFAAEAALAAREGRKADAARGYAEIIRLGRAFTPGGLFNDRLVGLAYESSGAEGLARLVPDLGADDARALAAEVERLDAGHEPLAQMFRRDWDYGIAQHGPGARLALTVQEGMLRRLRQPAEASAKEADRRARALLRSLAAALALRAYQLDHPGAPSPRALDALVPVYLKAVPADPFGSGTLRLKVVGETATVYSVGPDGRDDGGTPIPPNTRLGPGTPGDLVVGPF
jgi:hypothetical protein